MGKIILRRHLLYSNIGQVYHQQQAYDSALHFQKMALSNYQKNYGNKHPEIANTFNAIGTIYLEQKKYLAAVKQYQEAICANIPDYAVKDIYSTTPVDNYYNPDLLLISLQLKAQTMESLFYEKSLKKRDLLGAWYNYSTCDSLLDDIRRLKWNEADKITLGEKANELYADGIRSSMELAELSWKKEEYREKAFYFAEKSKSSVLLEAIADANAKSFANIPDQVIAKEEQLKSDIAYYKQLLVKEQLQDHRNQLFFP